MNNLLSLITNMPVASRFSLVMIGGGVVGYFVFQFFGPTGVMILLVGSLVVGLALAVYGFVLKRIEGKKAAGFSEEMKGQSAATPQSINKAEQLAKLDDLRKKFEEGVDKFRQAGKNIYSLPWYMLVGEPGSGKTEAIRHSSIGFPPGLQNELQGVGGTINMNWWFTNDAIILDLAGRLVFSEVEAGGGNEWTTFLQLLKTQRQNCPINGMVLVIPADSLIKDSAEVIHRKAFKISQQLNVVQRALDIRFPVFVMVTKSDLITGFREFFDPLHSPETQQQILGWSNPNSIDEPFKPDLTDQYLETVQGRLLRRRLFSLRDPTPSHDLSDSRFDEVDTLFDFPASFARISGPLKQYLQLIFVPSEWSSKPLFLRGIYFTSSMQEGAALDEELAKVLGISMDKVPEGRIWERERSFFLRDVFLNKIFLEKGLATRATNVRKQHLRRKVLLLGTSAAGLLILLLLTWIGGRNLEKIIGRERKLWMYASQELGEGRPLSVVVPRRDSPAAYDYVGADVVRLEDDQETTLGELHQVLNRSVQKPIEIPVIFRLSRLFDNSLNNRRRQARRVLFEVSVLQPVVNCVREKMNVFTNEWSPEATAALGGLIRIEADAARMDYDPKARLDSPADLNAFFRFLLDASTDYPRYFDNDRIVFDQSLDWSYSDKGGKGVWPPPWMPLGIVLSTNRPIDRGADLFVDHCCRSANLLEQQLVKVRALWADLELFRRDAERNYRLAETDFLRLFESNLDKLTSLRGFEAIEREWRRQYEALSIQLETVRRLFAILRQRYDAIPLCQGTDVAVAYHMAITNSLLEIQRSFATLPLPRWTEQDQSALTNEAIGAIRARMDKALRTSPLSRWTGQDGSALTNDAAGTIVVTMVPDIRARMDKALRQLEQEFQRKLEKDLREFVNLYDGRKLQVGEFATRFPLYEPIVIPETLRIRTLPWRAYQEQFQGMDVTEINRELEKVCKKIEQVFVGYAQVMTNVPRQRIEGLTNRARLGVDKVYSEAFFRDATEVVKAWGAMKGIPADDRETILKVSLDDFKRNYVVNTLETQEDYVAQYWQDLIYFALVSLADEIKPETDRLLNELKPYARFPLDLPSRSDRDLTVEELLKAKSLLAELSPLRTAGDGKTIGDGAGTGVKRVDEQLDRLRNLQLGEMVAWVNAANAVLAGLPGEVGRAFSCRVSILPSPDQYRMLQDFGRGMEDSILPIWRILDLSQAPRSSIEKYRTEQAASKQIGDLNYPGEPIVFRFYHYWGDPRDPQPEASRTLTYRGTWSVLRMLHSLMAKEAPGEPRKWMVTVSVEDENNRERFLWLLLEFEQPLPGREKWPRRPAAYK